MRMDYIDYCDLGPLRYVTLSIFEKLKVHFDLGVIWTCKISYAFLPTCCFFPDNRFKNCVLKISINHMNYITFSQWSTQIRRSLQHKQRNFVNHRYLWSRNDKYYIRLRVSLDSTFHTSYIFQLILTWKSINNEHSCAFAQIPVMLVLSYGQ